MQQRTSFDYDLLLGQKSTPYEIEPLRINIYTSQHCAFCNDALEVVHSTVDKISYIGKHVQVVETAIDDKPSLVEDLDILALPMIQIGHLRIIGLPRSEDIEQLIHETILMGF